MLVTYPSDVIQATIINVMLVTYQANERYVGDIFKPL